MPRRTSRTAIVICTFIPFVEELTFRGLGYSLLERFGRWPAILAVGVLFGLAHGLVLSLPVIVVFGCSARVDPVENGQRLSRDAAARDVQPGRA